MILLTHPLQKLQRRIAKGEGASAVGFIITNMARPAGNVVAALAEQRIKEGKERSDGRGPAPLFRRQRARPSTSTLSPTISATSCVRAPEPIKDWSLTSLKGN